MTTDGFAQWQITRQLASLMMELWCWRYGMKIGGLTGKVDKVYWYPALEWEMSLVAGKAVNQINSSYYSVPQKCPCVRLFCQVFNSDNFLMVPSRAHVRRWSFTLIYEKPVKPGNLWLICFQSRIFSIFLPDSTLNIGRDSVWPAGRKCDLDHETFSDNN